LVSPEVDKAKIVNRVSELTSEFNTRPWIILTQEDLEIREREEYERIGEL
jgi:hypothetical protein